MPRLASAALVPAALLAAACSESGGDSGRFWTEREAESITTIRSLPATVRGCDGLGESEDSRYARFECLAGTRAAWQTYDTIAVTYVLHPLAEYEGPHSRHRLTNVKFVGGPGIP
jgi:hypothetical protein